MALIESQAGPTTIHDALYRGANHLSDGQIPPNARFKAEPELILRLDLLLLMLYQEHVHKQEVAPM